MPDVRCQMEDVQHKKMQCVTLFFWHIWALIVGLFLDSETVIQEIFKCSLYHEKFIDVLASPLNITLGKSTVAEK